MANSQNSADLIKAILVNCGEVPDGTSEYHPLVEKFLNDAYLAVLSGGSEFNLDVGEPWVFARNGTPKSFVLYPIYEDGTVSLTNASASGTFSSAPAASLGSFANRFLKVSGRDSYYLITAHTAGASAFTLERTYLEATGLTLSFKAIPRLYNLGSGILRLVEPFRHYVASASVFNDPEETGKIYGMALNQLRQTYPIQLIKNGIPDRFATQRRNDTEWWVEVNACPQDPIKVDFDCIDIPAGLIDSDTSIPLIPRQHRKVLEYAASHFLALKKEEFEKADYYFKMTSTKLKAMMKEENKETTVSGRNKGRLAPRQEEMLRGNRPLDYY